MTYIATILIIITIAALSGIFTALFHHVIGNPRGVMLESTEQKPQGTYKAGRILSRLGRWVIAKHDAWEVYHAKIIWQEFDLWLKKAHEKLSSGKATFTQEGLSNKIIEKRSLAFSKRKPNPYNAFGACLVCFSIWSNLLLVATSVVLLSYSDIICASSPGEITAVIIFTFLSLPLSTITTIKFRLE